MGKNIKPALGQRLVSVHHTGNVEPAIIKPTFRKIIVFAVDHLTCNSETKLMGL